MADIENTSKSKNYVADNKIFIMGTLTQDSMYELLGRTAAYIDTLKPCKTKSRNIANITNPYILDNDAPIIDIYINSPGGAVNELHSLEAMLNIARSRGARIRTIVAGRAASAASLLAIQGDPGLRIMYQTGYHFIHHGSFPMTMTNTRETGNKMLEYKHFVETNRNTYLNHTKLSKKQLDRMFQAEIGCMYPDDCLKYGLCDWVLGSRGKFIRGER